MYSYPLYLLFECCDYRRPTRWLGEIPAAKRCFRQSITAPPDRSISFLIVSEMIRTSRARHRENRHPRGALEVAGIDKISPDQCVTNTVVNPAPFRAPAGLPLGVRRHRRIRRRSRTTPAGSSGPGSGTAGNFARSRRCAGIVRRAFRAALSHRPGGGTTVPPGADAVRAARADPVYCPADPKQSQPCRF